MTQKKNEGNTRELLEQAYSQFRKGLFSEAAETLEQALQKDFENEEIVSALKCARYWLERMERIEGVQDTFERSEFLLNQWKNFKDFLRKYCSESENCSYSIRNFVFEYGLNNYLDILETEGGNDPEILKRIGKCYKGIGDYEHALEYYEYVNKNRNQDAGFLAELADCYALVNEIRASKAFFREAFFINPQKIDVSELESGMIRRLIQTLSEKGFKSPELEEWIPVYGALYGIFNVKRELRPIEFGKLKQSIVALEGEIAEQKDSAHLKKPRLINHYFWLIDQFINDREERSKIDKILMKIRELDPEIYHEYIN